MPNPQYMLNPMRGNIPIGGPGNNHNLMMNNYNMAAMMSRIPRNPNLLNNNPNMNSMMMMNQNYMNYLRSVNMNNNNVINNQANVNMAQHNSNINTAFDKISKYCQNFKNVKLQENMPLFSSLSKFLFTTTNKLTEIRTKVDFSKLKSPFDFLKDPNNRIEELHKPLYQELKNICSCCGLRSKFYKDYIDHLDLHFNINLMERNSKNQRKVINRKELFNSSNWTTSNLSTLNSSTIFT